MCLESRGTMSMTKYERGEYRPYFDGKKEYACVQDYRTHEMACCIIEQAVYDWIGLGYGRRGFIPAHYGNELVYRADVESFFKGEWFEYLLGFALPDISPTVVRRKLMIDEPERRVCRARVDNGTGD